MARITPAYSEEILLGDLTPQQFLVLAHKALQQAGFNVGSISANQVLAYTNFSWRSWSEKISVQVSEQSATIKSQCQGSQLFDLGKNKKNVEDFIKTLYSLKAIAGREALDAAFDELKRHPDFDSETEVHAEAAKVKFSGILSVFVPTKGYWVTPILVNLNIVIFIIMCLSGADMMQPDVETLIQWGGNYRPMTLDGQWWRLFTCCFLHIGIIHLLVNMYALIYVGLLLEPFLGSAKFMLAYVLSGILASLTSMAWNDYLVSAGASGAIFGMYGVFLALLTTNFIEKAARASLLSSIGIFVVYNLLNGLKSNTVDNAAHIGGLLGGLFVGYCYYPILKNPDSTQTRNTVMSSVSIIVVLLVAIVIAGSNNDILTFQNYMKAFTEKETAALNMYKGIDTTNKKTTLKKLKRSVRLWFDNVDIIRQCKKLKLPTGYRQRLRLLEKYCYSRINASNFMYKGIDEDTEKYFPVIQQYNNEVESAIQQMESFDK